MTYARKDVVKAYLGASPKPGKPSREVVGHEQGDERPCIVVRPYMQLGLLTVIPCTTKKPKYNSYTIVFLPKGAGGLKEDTYALCHQIRTISVERIIESPWGKLPNDEYSKINTVLIDILL